VRAPRAERPAPATLSATGLFADTARLQPSPALFPYAVNAPFWSDHADKSRWLFVPPDRTIGFQPAGNWTFPAGTVAVKHFDLNTDERDPARRRRLETRVLVVDRAGGAYGRTYKWRADGTDADLLTGPVTERLTTTSKRPFGPLQTATLGGRPAGQAAPAADGALALQAPPGRTVFAHLTEAGDFDVAARFEAGAGATAGWMLRRQIEEQAPYLQVSWEAAGAGGNPAARLRLEVRARPGGPLSVSRHDGGQDAAWIRLQRSRGTLTIFTGADGHLWREVHTLAAEGDDSPQLGSLLGLALRAARGEAAGARVLASVRCEVRDHLYPGDGDCAACHTAAAGFVLGASTRQWNRLAAVGGERVNQLVLAHRRGLLDTPVAPADTATFRKLVPLEDGTAPLEDRVRSYFDVNCGQCHRPGMVAQVAFDARYDTPLAQQALVGARVRWPNVTHVADQMIYPRAPDRSRVFSFMSRKLMPPIGNLLVHQQAMDLVRTWIMGLSGPPALTGVTIRRSPPGPPDRPIEITLSHPDPQAAIHYTIDGTGPGPDTPRYSGPFRVPSSITVRAAAFRPGHVASRLASLELRE
jgi:hypothetical protein